MELKNMKMSKEEKNEMEPTALNEQEYPYGLCVRLEDEAISKLGLTGLPAAGSKVKLEAVGEVRSVSVSDDERGKKRSMEIQITDLGVGNVEESKPAETKLYGA